MNMLQLFSSPFFKALGWSLLHSLWQAAILFVLMKIILAILQQAKSSIKYMIAYSSVIAVALWFTVTFLRIYHQQISSLSLNNFSTQIVQHDFIPYAVHRTATVAAYVEHFLPALLAMYVAGLCILSIRLFNSYIQTIRLKNTSRLHTVDTWQQLAEALCGRIGLVKKIRLFLSETIDVPMTIGAIRPVILIPLAAVNSLSPEQMEAVLLHELSHIRRQDYLLNLIQSCIETVLFFNPFVLLIAQYIRKERENCCDEIVILHAPPHDYAQALVSLEEARTRRYRLALTAVNKEPHLFNRIKKIMEMKKKNIIPLHQKLAALLLAGIGLCSVAWISPNTSKKNNDPVKNMAVKTSNIPTQYSFTDSMKVPVPPVPKVFPENEIAAPAPPEPVKATAPLPARQLTDTPPVPPGVKEYFESDAWKSQQEAIQKAAEKIKEQMNSPEWKQYQKNIMAGAETMRKAAETFGRKFNSPEWKKQQYAFAQQAEKFRKQAEALRKKFDSPEWKKQQETFDRQTEKLNQYFQSKDRKEQQQKLQDQSKKLQEYFSSPEWKKAQDDIRHQSEKLQQYFQSKDWKEQQQKIQDQSNKLREYFDSDEWKKQWKEKSEQSKDSVSSAFVPFEQPGAPRNMMSGGRHRNHSFFEHYDCTYLSIPSLI